MVVADSAGGYVGGVVQTTLCYRVLAVAASLGDVHDVGSVVQGAGFGCLCW